MSLLKKKKKSSKDKKYAKLEKRADNLLKMSFDSDPGDDEDDDEEDDLRSEFKDKLADLDTENMATESRDIAVLKLMQQLVLDLIPIAEKNYKKFPSHTNASAVNSLISQERELEADIRALESFQQRADRIIDIVTAEYTKITENFITHTQALDKRLSKPGSSIKQELKEFMKDQSTSLIESRTHVSSRVLQMMVPSNDKKKSR